MTSDPLKIANVFNNYFSSIGEKTQSKTRFSNKNYTDYLHVENYNSFFITPTDSQEVISIISSLSDNKSSGPNSIPTRILKLLKKDISTQLVDIFNISFSSGIYSNPLKTANVIPIHKKDSQLEGSNYRPIALLSNVDKILEKLMHRRLSNFLDKNKLIYSLQFGFRKNYSTSYALIHLTETIKQSLDQGLFSCGIFVDLQKAFDTVDHDILHGKLEHCGIRGITNKWFDIYLKGRQQFFSINGYSSEHVSMPIGVPQGSVLGPLLFLLYINDLNIATIKHCKVHHFADHTNLLYTNNCIKKLNKFLNKDFKNLTNWLNANKITLKFDKTKMILFKPTKKPLHCQLKLKLNGKRLYQTSSVKYLGIKIDQYLNWQDHINNIAIKLNKVNAMLYKVRQFVNQRTLISIYHAIFDSHLNYASIVWGHTKSSINRAFIIQMKALSTIHFKGKFDHTSFPFSASNIIKLRDKISI